MSCLGEVNRGSPKYFCHEGSPRRPTVIFERASISPRREGSRLSEIPRVLLLPFSSPRLGEGGSPGRERLAWARPFSLSEEVCCGIALLLLDGWYLFKYDCYDGKYIMECYVCVVWFMDCGWWVWYELGMWTKWGDYY